MGKLEVDQRQTYASILKFHNPWHDAHASHINVHKYDVSVLFFGGSEITKFGSCHSSAQCAPRVITNQSLNTWHQVRVSISDACGKPKVVLTHDGKVYEKTIGYSMCEFTPWISKGCWVEHWTDREKPR